MAATVVCGGSSLAWSQESQLTFVAGSPASSQPAGPNGEIPNVAEAAPVDQLVSPAGLNTQPPGPFDTQRPPWLSRGWAADVEKRLATLAQQEAALQRPSVRVGGRIQADWALFDQSAANVAEYGNIANGSEFRRARIFISGTAFHVVDYKFEMDFANLADVVTDVNQFPFEVIEGTVQSTSFEDVYIGIRELPLLGRVWLGHFKEPFSLERLTSSKYITFMERSLGGETFPPGRTTGIMAFDCSSSERMTWAIGAFRTGMPADPPTRQNDSGGTSLTTRYTILPWYDEGSGGRGLLHFGVAYSFRDVDEFKPGDPLRFTTPARFRARPEAHLGPFVVDSDFIAGAEYWQLVGAEAAFVYGPFSLQTEYYGAFVHRPGQPEIDYHGVYAQVSYFLTGEHRVYNRTGGKFDRVVPFENFFRVRDADGCVQMGKGAWEVAYRYSYIDLNDAGVLGGRAGNHTFGLNWYLNPYTRLMWNYVNSRATSDDGPQSDLNIFEMRAQIDF